MTHKTSAGIYTLLGLQRKKKTSVESNKFYKQGVLMEEWNVHFSQSLVISDF